MNKRTADILLVLTLAGLFTALYLPAYRVMVSWWQGENYTYCWFVPLIAAYLAWEKRADLARVPALPSWRGLAALLARDGFGSVTEAIGADHREKGRAGVG